MYIAFYSSSKFMDFVKLRKDLKCFVISSCLLAGQFPDCWVCVCGCVCMYVCVGVCVCMWVCVCVCVCVCV